MKSNKAPGADETLDALFDGRIELYQSRAGYRFSLDAVLLAYFVTIKAGDRIVDLGAGNGAITLMLAFLHPSAQVTGIEIQPAMVERARRNVELNGLAQRISMRSGDVRVLDTLGEAGSFDVAVCNPPYRSPLSGRVSPQSERRLARHEFAGGLKHFLQAANALLKRRGRLALIYPAFRCVDVLTSMRAAGIEPKRFRMVHSSPGSEASLVLVEGVRGAKSEIAVSAPLIVYDQPRRYGAELAAMLSGQLPESK